MGGYRKRPRVASSGRALLLAGCVVLVGSCASTTSPTTDGSTGSSPGEGTTSASARSSAPGSGSGTQTGNGAIAFGSVEPTVATDGVPIRSSLVVRDRDGSRRLLATDLAYRTTPAWSPDGRSIAFVGSGGLAVVTIDGDRRQLTVCDPSTCVGDGPPTWSPDGTEVAFGAIREAGEGLFTVPSSGGEPRLLLPGLRVRGAPAWSADGQTIAVVADGVLLVDAGTGRVEGRVPLDGRVSGDGVAWSPDGTSLVLAARIDGVEGVYALAVDGTGLRLLSSCPDRGCTDLSPSWSPDGTRVVFVRGRCDLPGGDCFTGDLFVVPADGGGARPVEDGPSLDCCPAWQPVPQP
jgi:TolB protein